VKEWSHPQPDITVDWLSIIAKVKGDDPNGKDQLYRLFSDGIRFMLGRQLGPAQLRTRDLETFEILLDAVRSRSLDEPQNMAGLVRAIVLKQIVVYRDEDSLKPSRTIGFPGVIPTKSAIPTQTLDRMVAILSRMSPRERDALTRFYSYEQTQERICDEMELGESEFLLLKARAKTALAGTNPALTAKRLM
jgi:RNA polymerase sigma-70 factor, ECF subfamily